MSSAAASIPSLPYVIVGRGFAATVNRAMLLGGARLGNRQLIHVGYRDPWRGYEPVAMGQWPLLLTLPAYTMRPNSAQYGLMASPHFASITGFQWIEHYRRHQFTSIPKTLVNIVDHTTHFTLELHDGQVIHAEYVDICAGPGAVRRIPASVGAASILAHPGTPKRLLYAEDYLHRKTPKVDSGRVCVVGGGATGAWCVEHAQRRGNRVTWLSDKALNEAFVSSKRNDRLLLPPVVRKLDQGNHVVDGQVCPIHPLTTFGEYVDVVQLSLDSQSRVVVTHQPKGKATSVFTNLGGSLATLPHAEFDQVIWATGQATEVDEDGSWAKLLEPILAPARNVGRSFILDRDQKVVGLQSENEKLRILGASALAHPDVRHEWRQTGTPSNLYFRSLVEQARVPVGITVAAVAIAEANDYWSYGPWPQVCNPNLNTASLTDMKELMITWPPQFNSPEAWFESRGARVHPYEPIEMARMLTQQFTY